MSSREDVIEVPIEIQTSDLEELQRLIQQLQEAKTTVDQTKSARRKIPSGGIGAPIQRTEESPISIFRAGETEDVLPLKSRDTTSRQAFQRQSEFSKLREQMTNVQKGQASFDDKLNSVINNVFGVNIATGGLKQAPQVFSSAGKIISGGGVGMLTGIVSKLVPHLAVALVAYGFLETIYNELFKAGGIFDIRFKRNFKKESNILMSLEEKADIRAGRRMVRVTTRAGIRGLTNQQLSTYDLMHHGVAPYDLNGAAARGIL